jgi:hypothetical protein
MIRNLGFSILVACASLSGAQQAAKPTDSTGTASQPAKPHYDPGKVANQIRASYYHPDDLSSLDCGVAIDWAEFLSQLKTEVPEDRMKTLQGLKIKIHAARGATPEVKFDWTNGVPVGEQQFTDGFRQMLAGFYQMYWPMLASPLFSS